MVAIGTNEYTVTDLIPGATYNFRIAAYNVLEAQNTFPNDSTSVLNHSNSTSILAAIIPAQVTGFKQSLTGYVSG